MKKVLYAIICLLFVAGIAISGKPTSAEAAKSTTIKLAHGANEADVTGQTALKFQDLVKQYSEGRIKVQIFPNNQLGGEQEAVQDLRTGALEAAIVYTGNLKPMAPSVGVLMLPYMFDDNKSAWGAMDALYDELNQRVIKEAGVRFVGYFEKGFRVLSNSKKPVETIEDLKGLKIRVSKVDIAIETFSAWGLEPIPMAWSEVFTAMQQRVIDGQENPYAVINDMKFYEVQKYITEIHYLLWTGPILLSEKVFQSMSPEDQNVLVKAGKEAANYGRNLSYTMEQEAKKKLMEKGMVLVGPPKDEKKWKDAAMSIWPKFYKDVGGEEWVEKALGLIKANS